MNFWRGWSGGRCSWTKRGPPGPYPDVVDPVLAAILGGAVGLVIGSVAVLATRWSGRSTAAPEPVDPPLPRGVGRVLSVLKSIAVVLDASDAVVNTSASAVSYGLVRHGELVHHELRHIARQVRRDGLIREAELDLPRGPNAQASTVMRVRVAPIAVSHVLILAEDHTQARRVEEVRRDFVANVSHELKTPVGGISLLAEAVLDARDDPDAVERFAERILVESARLTRLVKEIVDLSRLQVADTLHEPVIVDVRALAAEAVGFEMASRGSSPPIGRGGLSRGGVVQGREGGEDDRPRGGRRCARRWPSSPSCSDSTHCSPASPAAVSD